MKTRGPVTGVKRGIGLVGAGALVLNGVIGAGIFALPGQLAPAAGNWGPVLFLIVGAAILTIVAAFAQLAAYYQDTGGPVLYAREAFGTAVGFQTGWFLYLGRLTALAANTNLLLDYGELMVPAINDDLVRTLLVGLLFGGLALINIIGVRQGVILLVLLSVLKLIPLIVLVTAGFSYISPDVLFPSEAAPIQTLGQAALLLVYAYTGFEGALVPAGETVRPQRTLPLALIPTVAATAVLYALIQAVYISVGDLAPVASKTPLADTAMILFGSSGAILMAWAAVLSVSGNLASIVLVAPRMTLALSEGGSLPAWFGRISPRFATPANSIVFLCLAAFALAASGSFVWLAAMSSLARIIAYGICVCALPRVRSKRGDRAFTVRDLHLPVALVLCAWAATQAATSAWIAVGLCLSIGTALYIVARRPPRPKGT